MAVAELIVVGVWAFVVSLVGGLVGLVLGNLRLPVMVLFATSPAAGAGANVAVSGARRGRLRWRDPRSLARLEAHRPPR
ncbi:MAG TPA: hypothetical protein VEK39_12735 [Solirubrobacterales bacterium]|nr:hypothetical protein [Solirubrobacterales bacterium]